MGSAAATQRCRLGMLEDGLKELERSLRDGLSELRQDEDTAREEQTGAVAALESAVHGTEGAGGETPASSVAQSQSAQPGVGSKTVVERPCRRYLDLVTAGAEPGEELVYGDEATAVIVRWREARDAAGKTSEGMDRLNARQRRLELETALVEEHKLTLPRPRIPGTGATAGRRRGAGTRCWTR